MWAVAGWISAVFGCAVALGCAAIAALLWRVSHRNCTLAAHASPAGHWRRVLRDRVSPPGVSLACIPTISDTAAVVTWTTAAPVATRVRAGPADGSLRAFEASPVPSRYHAVHLRDLQPDTAYRVQVSASDAGGPTLDFRTGSDIGPVRFRFAVLTDTHFKRDGASWPDGRLYRHGREVHERLLNGMLSHEPAFILHKGDCSEPPGRRRLGRYGDVMRRSPVPVHYIPGNHDYYRHRDFTADWTALTGAADTYTSFTYDNLHFALLDTCWTGEQERGFIGGPQLRWLRDDLAAHADTRTIIVTHHPVFGDAKENRACHDAGALCAVAAEHPRLCAIMSGHVHRNLVRWSDRLPGVPNIETASGIQYPIGYAIYEVGERGLRQTFHVVDDPFLSTQSWRWSWLRSVTNPGEPLGRPEDRNFVLSWPETRAEPGSTAPAMASAPAQH